MPKCKECKTKFEPKYFNQKYCMEEDECIKAFTDGVRKKAEEKKKKEWRKEKKEIKDSLKTASDYRKELQVIFNSFIRLRDVNKPCISCNRPLVNKYDAGHYFPSGSVPNLRYDEDNVHAQCVHCNRDKHGNLIEYGINLPDRIGIERLEQLKERRNEPLHLGIEEIKDLKLFYKQKIKLLEDDN